MNCDAIKNQTVNYLKEELEPNEHLHFEKHLSQCENCQSEIQQLKSLWLVLIVDSEFDSSEEMYQNFQNYLKGEIDSVKLATNNDEILQLKKTRFSALWPSSLIGALSYSAAVVICGFLVGRLVPTEFQRVSENSEISLVQEELAEMRDLMTLTLLRQESIQDRLRGVDFALQSKSRNPQLISLLLDTAEQDDAGNVRLAALDALELHQNEPEVRDRLFESLILESYPLVQLRKAEILLNAAGSERNQLLNTLIEGQMIDANVGEFLRDVDQDQDSNRFL